MLANRWPPRIVILIGIAAGLGGPSAGCNRPGASGGTAAPINPVMKKKADENLKDYAARAAARAQERRAKAKP